MRGNTARSPATQGHGKVAFHEVSSRLMGRLGCRAWCRRASAMLVAPARRSRLIAVLRRVAMTWGPWPVRIWDLSSSKVTSRTQWRRFSIPRWPWTQAARTRGGAAWWSAEGDHVDDFDGGLAALGDGPADLGKGGLVGFTVKT